MTGSSTSYYGAARYGVGNYSGTPWLISGNVSVSQSLAAGAVALFSVSGQTGIVVTASMVNPQPVSGAVVLGISAAGAAVRIQSVVGSASFGTRLANSQINQGTSIYGAVSLGLQASATGTFGKFWAKQVVNQPSWRDVTIGEYTNG